MKLLHVCLCVCALLSSAEMFKKKKLCTKSPCEMHLVTRRCNWYIYIYFEFQLEAYWFETLRRKKNHEKNKKIKTSNIFVLIKLGKVLLSSQKQTYHSFTYFYPVKTGKNPVVDTHLCKYGRCNQVTKKPLD